MVSNIANIVFDKFDNALQTIRNTLVIVLFGYGFIAIMIIIIY